MHRIGLRCQCKTVEEEFYRKHFYDMQEGNIHYTELSISAAEALDLDFKMIKKQADAYGINVWTAHLPFRDGWAFPQRTAEERKRAYELQTIILDRVADTGVDKFVVHPCWTAPDYMERSEAIDIAKDALCRLADFADERGARLAVENLPKQCIGRSSAELADIISVNPKLRVCFDVNHLSFDTHEGFLDALGDKILTMHISDYDFEVEKHWFPGEGKIDWVNLYKKVCEVGYEGVWMYELNYGAINPFRSRPLTVGDFYNNAMDIFSGKAPSRV